MQEKEGYVPALICRLKRRLCILLFYNDQSLQYFFRYLLGLRGRLEGDIETEGITGQAWKEEVGFLPLKGGYYPEMTVSEQLQFMAGVFPDFSRAKADELIHRFKLSQDKRLKDLPDFLRKITILIGLLAGNAAVLFFEEPLSQMPVEEQKQLQEIFTEEAEKGRAILFSLSRKDKVELEYDLSYLLTAEGIIPRKRDEKGRGDLQNKGEEIHLKKIPVWKNEKATLIDYDRIRWISTNQGKSYIHTGEGEYEVNVLLRDLEKRLNCPPFFRCHRSFIVNLNYVDEVITWFNGTYNLRIGDEEIPVSRNKARELNKLLGV